MILEILSWNGGKAAEVVIMAGGYIRMSFMLSEHEMLTNTGMVYFDRQSMIKFCQNFLQQAEQTAVTIEVSGGVAEVNWEQTSHWINVNIIDYDNLEEEE